MVWEGDLWTSTPDLLRWGWWRHSRLLSRWWPWEDNSILEKTENLFLRVYGRGLTVAPFTMEVCVVPKPDNWRSCFSIFITKKGAVIVLIYKIIILRWYELWNWVELMSIHTGKPHLDVWILYFLNIFSILRNKWWASHSPGKADIYPGETGWDDNNSS